MFLKFQTVNQIGLHSVWGCLEPTGAHKKSTMYSVRSTTMEGKRSLKPCRRRRGILPGLALQGHNHQCCRRRRFDYHSGLLTTWRGPENSERRRGWIERGIPGCRQTQNLHYRETFISYPCLGRVPARMTGRPVNKTWHGRIDTRLSTQGSRPERD
jgi:hypothetical protein